MKYVLHAIILYSTALNAEWFCREASSRRIGNTIEACGIGFNESQQKSKDDARESAINEFERICSKDVVCRDFEVSVNPKRTECIKEKDKFKCFRAIDFEITSKRKSDIFVDVDQVRSQLMEKRRQLSLLQDQLNQLENLKKVDQELKTTINHYEELTGETIVLSRMVSDESLSRNEYKYTHLVFDHSIRTYFNYYGNDLTKSGEFNIGLNLSYERRFWRTFGLVLGVGFSGDFSSGLIESDGDIPSTGTFNSTQEYLGNQSTKVYLVGLIYYSPWWGTYLKAELGNVQYERELYEVSYGSLGTKTNTVKSKNTGNKNFVGGYLGFDSRHDYKGFGFFSEIGLKLIESSSKVTINVGLNYGF